MRAVILAAGRGSRMKGHTENKPKCLVALAGKSLLQRQVESLRSAGIESIAVVTGYRSQSLSSFGLHEFHNHRWTSTNMVSSLRCARDWLCEDECIVSYSDIFYEPSAIISLSRSPYPLTILYDINWRKAWSGRFANPLDDAESFMFDGDSFVFEIGRKVADFRFVQGQYMGLLKFDPHAWSSAESFLSGLSSPAVDKMYMTELLQGLISSATCRVKALPYSGQWGEIDSPQDLAYYHRVISTDD